MSSLAAVWRSPWLAPLNDVTAINDLLAQFNGLWSLDQVRARVLSVDAETPDTRTFVLQANRHWRGHAAGQHVVVEVEIDGVRRHRTFTVASAPDGTRRLSLTVKRQPRNHAGGLVTGWMHDHLRKSMVIGLSAPLGSFVLPPQLPRQLLMLSAGSGITPVMSMLRALLAGAAGTDIQFVHVCRTPADAIFRVELERLARSRPNLKLRFWHTARQGRMDMRALEGLVPDAGQRHTLLCGPQGFMQEVLAHWQAQGWPAPQHESFGAPIRYAGAIGESVSVRAHKSERVFTATTGLPLLQEAEAAGLKPAHGCRIGICQSCKCVKRSGAVRNLLTGAVSAEPNEQIQLCISAAASDLTLEL